MNLAATILIDALTYASWLFIVALGLTLVFGVLKILNIAHGSFYALGAYAAASFVGWFATMKFAPGWSLRGDAAGGGRRRRAGRAAHRARPACASSTAATRSCWCSSPTPCS